MHGKGVYTWKDGRRYEGEYQHDKKHGWGVYTWADGRRYEGPWAYGKQHGKGKYILPDNTVRIGIWDNGKRIKWLDEDDGKAGSPDAKYNAGNAGQNGYSASPGNNWQGAQSGYKN
jgi:hypothetical protein